MDKMKKYQVELEYTSYIMYEVEANSKEEAEDKAWEMLNSDSDYMSRAGDWGVYTVKEIEDANG